MQLHPGPQNLLRKFWGHSSTGRALALQARGRRFDPDWLHKNFRSLKNLNFIVNETAMGGVGGRNQDLHPTLASIPALAGCERIKLFDNLI